MKIVMLAPFGIWPKGTVLSRMLPLGHSLAGKGNKIDILLPQEKEVSFTAPIGGGSLSLLSVSTGSQRYAFDDLTTTYEMMRKASSFDPDLIHVFKPKGYGGLAGMLKLGERHLGNEKIPIVLDGDDHEGFGGMNDVMDYPLAWKLFFHFQERFLPRISDRMTLASTYLMDYYSGFGAKREHMVHLPNGVNPFIHSPEGVDEGLMDLLSKYPFAGGEETVAKKEGLSGITAGIEDLVPEETISLFTRFRDHGAERVLNIFRSVQKQNPRVKFLLAGDGGKVESVYFRKKMEKNLKKGSFIFTGTFPFSSLIEVFSHAGIAMVPMDDSNITRSKCSAKLVDLMAMGKAVVADNIGENGNYIEDEVCGYLVHNIVDGDPDDIIKSSSHRNDSYKKNTEEFTERLVYLLDNPRDAKKLGREARKRIYSNFSWGGLAAKVAALYRELV